VIRLRRVFHASLLVVEVLSIRIATLVFLPGVVLRLGLHRVLAGPLGLEVAHSSFGFSLGGELEVAGSPRSARRLIGITALASWGVGTICALPMVVRIQAFDVAPFPRFSRADEALSSHDLTTSSLASDIWAHHGTRNLVTAWVAVGAIFMTARALQDYSVNAASDGGRRTVLGTLAATLASIDAVLGWLGANVFICSGVLFVAATWFGASALVAVVA
jgi:hypothetical protein